MERKQVLLYRELPPQDLARLQAQCEVVFADPRKPGQAQAFLEALPHVHGLIGSSYRIDDALLDQARRLEVIRWRPWQGAVLPCATHRTC
jgi:gluconate 2-dehydrogenase